MKKIFVLIFYFAFVSLSVSLLFAQEKKIDKNELPANVLNSFKKNYQNAIIKGASIEKENGKIYYEIESIDGAQRRDFLYTKAGKVAEIEETLTANDIPDIVKSSVMKNFPGGKINRTEKVTNKKSISYELVVEQGEQKHEVVLDSKGNIQKVKKMKKEN